MAETTESRPHESHITEDLSEDRPTNAPLALPEASKKRPHLRLTHDEKRKILVMRQEGVEYALIAKALKRSVTTVWDYCQPFEDTSAEALAKLRAASARAADTWAEAMTIAAADGNHRPAKELLEAAGAIKPQADHVVGVQVNIAGGGESGSHNPMPPELIDVSVDSTST